MILAVLGSLGGVVAFCGAAWVIVRAIFRNVNAVEDNTEATNRNTRRLDTLESVLMQHGERIAALEGWMRHDAGKTGQN